MNFLKGWELTHMPYRIWEYVSEISFAQDTLPTNETLLEHGRLFGEGGDLTLRRDGAEFRWHFVGEPEMKPPEGYGDNNFWAVEANKGVIFHKWCNEAMLWGEYKKELGRWHDNRVARAKLTYPISNGREGERVMINYYTFSQAGQVQFVWFRELDKWKKENENANG